MFERKLENGATEYYEVLDRGFYRGMHGIPDHYQVSAQKTTTKAYTNSVKYYISNGNDKININSEDSSVNINVALTEEDKALFETFGYL